jgi:hypothetical protein
MMAPTPPLPRGHVGGAPERPCKAVHGETPLAPQGPLVGSCVKKGCKLSRKKVHAPKGQQFDLYAARFQALLTRVCQHNNGVLCVAQNNRVYTLAATSWGCGSDPAFIYTLCAVMYTHAITGLSGGPHIHINILLEILTSTPTDLDLTLAILIQSVSGGQRPQHAGAKFFPPPPYAHQYSHGDTHIYAYGTQSYPNNTCVNDATCL